MFDVNSVRRDFPMIVNNPDLIYFDNGATTYKPQAVIYAITGFYHDYTSNIERGEYPTAIMADKAYMNTRKVIARMINCQDRQICFMGNITACLNQIAYGLGRDLHEGDTVLISYAEHASNVLPWFRLKRDKGINIRYVPLDMQGNLKLDELEGCFDDSVKVVSLAYVTNVLGSHQPIKEICEIAHRHDALVVVDAAQAIGHIKIDVEDLDVDLLCFSSHKMCGPDGVGVLYGKYDLLQQMEPILLGGGMNARFEADGTIILKDAPERFEAGTPDIEGVIGLAAAAEYLMNIGLDDIHEYEKELRSYFIDKMKKLDNVEIYNPDIEAGPVAFNVKGIFAQDVATYLSTKNIAVRSGNHCAKILHNLIGVDQSVRASLYFYNTKEEIDRFVDEISKTTLEATIDVFL
ncbi:MAG: cysteine desulfurase [Erysipelotrichaceae bacterium]|nr:cysteine desulfurase [Erysipelotrichaceae bacterium]